MYQKINIISSTPELGLGTLFASDNVVKLRLLHRVYQLGVLALITEVVMAEAEWHLETFVTLEYNISLRNTYLLFLITIHLVSIFWFHVIRGLLEVTLSDVPGILCGGLRHYSRGGLSLSRGVCGVSPDYQNLVSFSELFWQKLIGLEWRNPRTQIVVKDQLSLLQ